MLSLLRFLIVLLLVVTLAQGAPPQDMTAFNRMAKGSQEVPEPLLEKAHDYSVIVETDRDVRVDFYLDDVTVKPATHLNADTE